MVTKVIIMNKVTTGIKGLDKLLSGGYPERSIIAVSGGVGTGKSVLGMQFITSSDVDNPGLLISFDLNKKNIANNMSSFNWNLSDLEKEGKMVAIEFPPEEINQILEREGAIKGLINSMNIKRVVIDPIVPFSMLYPGEVERRKMFFKLLSAIREWNTTTLIIDQDGKYLPFAIPKSQSGVESVTDGFIHLSYKLEGKKRQRGLEIIKMRNCPDDTLVHDLKIDSKGITITDVK